jgi:hypothetical protein
MSVKHSVSLYPFKDEKSFKTGLKFYSMQQVKYTDTVLTGGVWRGAFIGGLIGIAVAALTITGLENDWGSLSAGDRAEIVGWCTINGAGIGGMAGFGRQRKRQRQLNKQRQSLP